MIKEFIARIRIHMDLRSNPYESILNPNSCVKNKFYKNYRSISLL